jgi:hypothetical protein
VGRTYGNSPPRQAIPAKRCLKAGRVAHRRSADPFLADLAERIDEHPSAVVLSGHAQHAYWPVEDGHFGDGSPPGRPSRCCGAGAGWSTRQAGPDSSASLKARSTLLARADRSYQRKHAAHRSMSVVLFLVFYCASRA